MLLHQYNENLLTDRNQQLTAHVSPPSGTPILPPLLPMSCVDLQDVEKVLAEEVSEVVASSPMMSPPTSMTER